ncbi:potassium voltage-gated channel subfamily H member 8-like isoform X2 [Amphibalanus amphitrite]|uniref:potassium voltage-gated channel subfamily H member 8-like isoform X2 n=1 Tax=Amphibalanus amphitrite TaxID=1232801 RepID=UPI001C91F91B|nr:potassium voltage-gated channel subfamily H member 8-like isoform X2 [Amphibalanus amphitrite]
MPNRKGLLAPQNTFLDTIATRFDGTHSNFVLGNAKVSATFPIVYCSDGFCDLTGFARAQIMQKGCACRFLYGADTAEDHRRQIELALQEKTELKLEVMFYRKNGSPFWCLLDIVPIKNEKREVVLFLASHKDITPTKVAQMSTLSYEDQDDDHLCDNGERDPNGNELDVEAPPINYQRRRSRAVLYQLSGHYTQERKSKIKLNNSLLQPGSTAPLPEYKTVSAKRSKFVLSHYGIFKSCWDWLILVATFYVAVVVPYNASFVMDRDRPSVVSDVVVEALFLIDIILNFRTTYVNKKGEVVSNPRYIATNYLKGWFIVDLLAALPFDLLFAADVYSSETPIHLLKLTRLLRLVRLLQKIDRYTQYSSMILTLLLVLFSLAAHWLACVWYVLADRERQQHPADWDIGWIPQLAERLHLPVDNVTTEMSYITALYFTCTSLTSVGFGNVSANTNTEKIFSVVVMLVGALMHAAVFGNVTAIVQRMYAKRSLYDSKWNDLNDFLTLYQVPKELKQRIQDYFQTMWSLNHGIDMGEILHDFPEELRGDVSMHIHRELLQLPIFVTASTGCQKLLSLHVKDSFCAPGEYLVHCGDALHYIYYLCNGSMEVVQTDMVVAILGKGDLVGCDIQRHLQDGSDVVVKSSSDVRALTYCDLKCLHIGGLVEVLKLYQDFQQDFSNDIRHDLTYNLREGYEADVSSDTENSVGPGHTLPSISEDNEAVEEAEEVEDPPLSPQSPNMRRNGNSRLFCEDSEPLLRPRRGVERSPLGGQHSTSLSPMVLRLRRLGSLDNMATDRPRERDRPPDDSRAKVDQIHDQVQTAVQLLQTLTARTAQQPAARATCDQETQTEFPTRMLEEFVSRNKDRVLALLGVGADGNRVMNAAHPRSPQRGVTFALEMPVGKSENAVRCRAPSQVTDF